MFKKQKKKRKKKKKKKTHTIMFHELKQTRILDLHNLSAPVVVRSGSEVLPSSLWMRATAYLL